MNMNTVKVIFEDAQYNYETSVSADTNEEKAKEYFVGVSFDMGNYPKELFKKCIAVEFTDNNKPTEPEPLKHFKGSEETARRAYYWTSFSPEKRGDSFLKEHDELLCKDLAALPADQHEYYIKKFKELVLAYLHSHSNVASSMITGPARFPTERNRKRSDWADNKYKAFTGWRDWFFKKIEKQERKEAIAEAGGELEIAKRNVIKLTKMHTDGKTANKIIKAAIKAKLNPAELREQLKDLDMGQWLDFTIKHYTLGEYHFCGILLSNIRVKVKNWEQRVKTLEARQTATPKEVNTTDGIRIVQNTPINRVQIFFPGKPDEATRSELKRHGYRWSPTNGCWQAYNNNRSVEFARTFITPKQIAA